MTDTYQVDKKMSWLGQDCIVVLLIYTGLSLLATHLKIHTTSFPQIYFLIASGILIGKHNARLYDLGFKPKSWKIDIGIGLACGIVCWIIPFVVLPFLPFAPEMVAAKFPSSYELLTVVFLAPITEEVFFRGLLFFSFLRVFGAWRTIILTTLLFWLVHMHFGPGPLLLGIVAAILTLIRGSFVAAIVLHILCNALGPVMLNYFPEHFSAFRTFFL